MSTSPQTPQPPRVPDELTDVDVARAVGDEQWDRLHVTGEWQGDVLDLLDVSECRLTSVLAHGIEVRNLTLTDVVLDGCDLSGSLLRNAVLRRVAFRDCRLSGLVLDGSTLRDVTITSCKLDTANLRSLDTQRVLIESSVLREVDFTAARLGDARLEGCDLRGARFTKAAARGLRLGSSDVGGIVGADSLRGAIIDETQVAPFAMALFDALGVRIDQDAPDAALKLTWPMPKTKGCPAGPAVRPATS